MFAALCSKSLTLFLLAALVLVLTPATVSKLPLFITVGRLLLVLLAINLSLCTVRRWRYLAGSVILIHAGILVILAGSLAGRAGFVATVNIYEKESTTTAFRWDRQQDFPLGFTLRVRKINRDFYPTSVRIGVLMDGRQEKLYELKSGENFTHAGNRIEVLDLDPVLPALHLAVTSPGGERALQTLSKEIPARRTGLALQLVGFQTPVVKRSWVDLDIISGSDSPVLGQAEVNHPFIWRGLRFYHTATNADPLGQPYAGLQIVDDQGIPVVYLGFLLLCLGNVLILLKKGRRRGAKP